MMGIRDNVLGDEMNENNKRIMREDLNIDRLVDIDAADKHHQELMMLLTELFSMVQGQFGQQQPSINLNLGGY